MKPTGTPSSPAFENTAFPISLVICINHLKALYFSISKTILIFLSRENAVKSAKEVVAFPHYPCMKLKHNIEHATSQSVPKWRDM